MMETVVVLASILRHVSLKTVPGQAFPQDDARITLRPTSCPLLIEQIHENINSTVGA